MQTAGVDPSSVIVRSPLPGDLPALAALLGQLGHMAAVPAVAARLERLARQANTVVFVAERDGAAVGMATAHLLAVLHADDPVAILSSLVVAESERGRGTARRYAKLLPPPVPPKSV